MIVCYPLASYSVTYLISMSHNVKIPQNTFSVAWATLALPIPYRQKFLQYTGKASMYEQLPGNLSRKGFVPIRGEARRVTWGYFYIFVVVYCGDHPYADPQTALCH